MQRSKLLEAIETNCPFTVHMADGNAYSVPHRDYIALPPKSASAFVFDDRGGFKVLSLLTMTSISVEGDDSPPAPADIR